MLLNLCVSKSLSWLSFKRPFIFRHPKKGAWEGTKKKKNSLSLLLLTKG